MKEWGGGEGRVERWRDKKKDSWKDGERERERETESERMREREREIRGETKQTGFWCFLFILYIYLVLCVIS